MKKLTGLQSAVGVITAAAAALVITISLNIIAPSSQPIPSDPSHIYTWDCEYPEHKPSTITIMCADGGISVNEIKWSTWDKSGATGTGTFNENLCEPSCVEGKEVSAPVTIKLSGLKARKGKYYLRTLDIRTRDGKDFPWGRANGYHWDVMEFAEQMNWD